MALVYRNVPSGNDPDDAEPTYHRPRFGGAREEWWWQPGPVDSCCCCGWSLRVGVGLLASWHLMFGAICSYVDTGFFYQTMAAAFREEYQKDCAGVDPEPAQCGYIRENWVIYGNRLIFLQTYGTLFHVSETLSIVAGLLGLWAACRANALAAKMYLWSWLLLSLLGQVMQDLKICSDYSQIENANAGAPPTTTNVGHHWGAVFFSLLATLIWFAYCFKVIRSYHIRLKNRNRGDPTSSGGGIELDTYDGTVV